MRVGEVQYYLSYSVELFSPLVSRDTISVSHIFTYVIYMYVMWKKLHPHWDYLGASNYCAFKLPAVSCYLPVQRIHCRAAHAVMCKRLLVECSIHTFAGLWQYRSYRSIPACTTILCCRGYSNNLP